MNSLIKVKKSKIPREYIREKTAESIKFRVFIFFYSFQLDLFAVFLNAFPLLVQPVVQDLTS